MIRLILGLLLALTVAITSHAYTRTVNVTGSPTPCASIMWALEPYLAGRESGDVSISGVMKVGFDDLGRIKWEGGEAPYKYCWGYIPDGTLNTEGHTLHVHYDLTVEWDATGQDEAVVLFQRGNGYNSGFSPENEAAWDSGYILEGVSETGRITFVFKNRNTDPGWKVGRIPKMSQDTLIDLAGREKNTSTIAIFDTGYLRGTNSMATSILGPHVRDYDDIGWLNHHNWSSGGGALGVSCEIRRLGTGVLGYHFMDRTIHNCHISFNAHGIVLSDPENAPGMKLAYAKCKSGKCTGGGGTHTTGLRVRNSTIEGNVYGNVVITSASRILFDGNWIESSTTKGHGVLIGGGYCGPGSREFLPCCTDLDCGEAGLCKVPGAGMGMVSFQDGVIWGGKNQSEEWAGLCIGKGTGNHWATRGMLKIGSEIIASKIDGAWMPFRIDPSARLPISLCGAHLTNRYGGWEPVVLPDYDHYTQMCGVE